MELFDTAPTVAVDEAEYVRLLGFPRGHVMEGRARELGEWARTWYAEHGRPWIYARESDCVDVAPGSVVVDGAEFRSARLERILREAHAHSVVLVAVSAGPEIEQQAHQAWLAERPDEYFFLEMFGSAVVEHLTTIVGARLCGWADGEQMAVLPHYSPGYPEWEISEQSRLFALLGPDELPGALEVLDSGMLRPKKSLLAAFGLTRHIERVARLTGLVPCENCSFAGCQFRRVPYGRAPKPATIASASTSTSHAQTPSPAYGISPKALRRWAQERLTLTTRDGGAVDAVFRYEGTTCSSMGRRLSFNYQVTLGPREAGHPIQSQACTPAEDDDGHQTMCEYVRDADRLMRAISGEQPLIGRSLDAVLSWKRPLLGAGCFCEAESREHKWGLVLETIHYALNHSVRG